MANGLLSGIREPEPYPRSALLPMLVCFAVGFCVAILSVYLASVPETKHQGALMLDWLLKLVPSAGLISGSMADPEAGEVILLAQWLFFPVYLFAWFYSAPPWSARMRQAAKVRAHILTDVRRQIFFPISMLFLIAWIAGDIGLISFPTLYNGKFVYPVANAVMQLRSVYSSPTALAIYAWFGPVAEAMVVWMLSYQLVNVKTFMALDSA
jgi:hypothetical protein